jgi:hypothetical protein
MLLTLHSPVGFQRCSAGRPERLVHSRVQLLRDLSLLFACWICVAIVSLADDRGQVAAGSFELATFSVDVTVPLGHRSMGILPTKTQRVGDPLEARGFLLYGAGAPVAVLVVDWCELRNAAYDEWRDTVAAAAGTSRERVLVSCVHQHDAPIADKRADELLRSVGLANELYDIDFHQFVLQRIATAVAEAALRRQPVTHVGVGQARVERIASNRRVQLNDGTVSFNRGSRSATNPVMRDAPVGQIDPILKTLSFWNGERAVCAISVYATHPMSHYGGGTISADFPGLARRRRQAALPNVFQIYASGCSGDVTAGKFNDGSETAKRELTERMTDAMQRAWEDTDRHPLQNCQFRSVPLHLDYSDREELSIERLRAVLNDTNATTEKRILAAMAMSSAERVRSGQPIDVGCIDFQHTQFLLLPAESFVSYQLSAQQLRPDSVVIAVGYGECWPGYIPSADAVRNGFDGHNWMWVTSTAETAMMTALRRVLLVDQQ